jgi:hypothetical protein
LNPFSLSSPLAPLSPLPLSPLEEPLPSLSSSSSIHASSAAAILIHTPPFWHGAYEHGSRVVVVAVSVVVVIVMVVGAVVIDEWHATEVTNRAGSVTGPSAGIKYKLVVAAIALTKPEN